ncbi:MAG TPA: tetratricopeptide repeat protein [Terriglobia bacterium]|nr:tetratricopeptide repeat protein [Terriglobia bacterium]
MRQKSISAIRPAPKWTSREAYLLAVICLLSGLALGYVVRGPSTAPAAPIAHGDAATTAPTPFENGPPSDMPGGKIQLPAGSSDMMAAPLLAALKADPKNADILIQLGNLYSDNRDNTKAIDYYQRALDQRPSDVNVRTDLGTSYWYKGDAEKAVAEYRRSLSINPTHPQSLFNLGVVLAGGLKDYAGAINAWEKLLKTNPDYPEKPRVLSLIEDAKTKSLGPAALR